MSTSRALTRNLDSIFDALADGTRRSMLDRLRCGPQTVTALAAPYAMSLNGVSKHIKKLEKVGLVRRHVRGREHFCALDASVLEEASGWINHYSEFWENQITALEKYLIDKKDKERK